MIKPYYETELGKLYHGDCLEILPQIEQGVVVTDPPYNVGYHYNEYNDALKDEEYHELLRKTVSPPSVILHYPEDMFIVSYAIGEYPKKCVSWVYNAHTPRKWRMAAWFGIKPVFSLVKQPYKNLRDKRILDKLENGHDGANLYDWWEHQQVKNVSEEKTEHPCQIPSKVMEKIIGITPCDVITDPFLGSGTTAVACERLGRRWIGIEISKEYCDIAVKRIERERSQLKLCL